jgi:hypothetical protein
MDFVHDQLATGRIDRQRDQRGRLVGEMKEIVGSR